MRKLAWFTMLAAAAFAADASRQVSGKYQVTLRVPPEGLFAREEMEIEFRVEDTSRPDPLGGFAGVVRAAPEAAIDMPEMPAMPKFAETAHPEGVPGDYGIHPTFAHGGDFRLRLEIHPVGGEAFEAVFPLSVMDAGAAARRKPVPPRYWLEIAAQPKRPKAGEAVEMRLVVRDRDTGNSAVEAFDRVHEAPMHLVVVRKDLDGFAHLHPELDDGGRFRLRYTFAVGGEYRLFADVAPRAAGGQVLMAKLNVAGAPGAPFDARRAWGARAAGAHIAGHCAVEMTSPDDGLPARKTIPMTFRIRDTASGEPPRDLEPYLGAAGHLMLVHEDGESFVHSHPVEGTAADGELRFAARLPKAGIYRGWLQFMRAGKVQTVDLLLRASEPQ